MEDCQGLKQLEFTKIPWDTAYFTIPDILRKFKFPQIVKVIAGFYGESNDSTVSANQILCLHCVKSIKKIRAYDSNGKVFSLSLDCQKKVEVRPSKLKDIYDNVDELCKVFPRYVRVSQGYYDASKDEEVLNVGDKLKLRSVEKSKTGEKKLICINQNDNIIVLSQDCVASFQPLFDDKEYYLAEVLKSFSLPLYVRFVEPNIMDEEIQRPLGTVYLEATYSETVITATTIRSDGQYRTVEFASDMDFCLAVCEEKFRKRADYVKICQSLKVNVDSATESKSSSGTTKKDIPLSNTVKPNSAAVGQPIVSLSKQKVMPPEPPRVDSAKAIPPKPPPRKAIPDTTKGIQPKPPPRAKAPPESMPDPTKMIPPKRPLKAIPDLGKTIPAKAPPETMSDPTKTVPPKSSLKTIPDSEKTTPAKPTSFKAKPVTEKVILPKPTSFNLAKADPGKTIPPTPTSFKAKADPGKAILPKPTSFNLAKPDPGKTIPPTPTSFKAKPDTEKAIPPKPTPFKAKPDTEKAILPKPTSFKAKPDTGKVIFPKPTSFNLAKPDPGKTIPPTPTSFKAKPDTEKVILPKPTSFKAKPDTEKVILPKPVPRKAKVTAGSQKKKPDLRTQDSQHRPTVDDSGYAVPDEVFNFKNVRSTEKETYSECKLIEDSQYTQLDPTYVSTNSNEYAKLRGEYQSIPETSATGNNQPAKSNPPPHLRTSDMATRPLPQVPVSPPHLPTEPVRSPDHMPVDTPTREEIYEAIAKYPKDLSNLTVTEVRKLMHNIGMGNYAEMFEAELVDGVMLTSMNAESLQSLNSKNIPSISEFSLTLWN